MVPVAASSGGTHRIRDFSGIVAGTYCAIYYTNGYWRFSCFNDHPTVVQNMADK